MYGVFCKETVYFATFSLESVFCFTYQAMYGVFCKENVYIATLSEESVFCTEGPQHSVTVHVLGRHSAVQAILGEGEVQLVLIDLCRWHSMHCFASLINSL
jgi:hypothetical protein